MKLPMDPSRFGEWGVLVLQSLIQQISALEPYVQLATFPELPSGNPDPEGNAVGVIPLVNGMGHIPIVVKNFELKPLDLLILKNGPEDKFLVLNEANAVLATGGLAMGTPIDKEPTAVDSDMGLDMVPPHMNMNGNRQGPMGVFSQVRPVKLAGLEEASAESVEAFFKAARELDAELPEFLAAHFRPQLQAIAKSASESVDAPIITLDPVQGGVSIEAHGSIKSASLASLPEAGAMLRRLGLDDKVPSLMRGELVVIDPRTKTKEASAFSHVATGKQRVVEDEDTFGNPVTTDGWYKIDGALYRTFKTTYLDGRPCTKTLAVSPLGWRFERTIWGKLADAPNSQEMKRYFDPSHLMPGDMGFIVKDKTGEATVPFVVKGQSEANGSRVLVVEPLLGDTPTVTIRFGNNQHVYPLGPGEVAYPKSGFTAYKMQPKRLDSTGQGYNEPPAYPGGDKVKVKIFRGGGVYSVREGGHTPFTGLTRGQLAALLMDRYGMNADMAIDYVRGVNSYEASDFCAVPKEKVESKSPAFHNAGAALALKMFRAVKLATDENKNGPNRDPEQPGPSGPNPVQSGAGMGPGPTPSMGAAILPEIPGLKEVADMLTSYALGQFAPDELGEIYSQLIAKLEEAIDLAGRVLLLVRLGKVDFITENEAKRLVEESEKFRSALLNADMLNKGTAMMV